MVDIKFLHPVNMEGVYPEPAPSYKHIPAYFKATPRTFADPQRSNLDSPTVKGCVPFIEAMSQGYIIPLWEDIQIIAKDGQLSIISNGGTADQHYPQQMPNHPLSADPYTKAPLKFRSPWVIETKAGYSCLFTAPMNHLETRFKILDGVVETDKYYNSVNFPCVWTGGEGEFIISKGTPIAQVIPFKREKYIMDIGVSNKNKVENVRAKLYTKLTGGYRAIFWSNIRKDIE